MSIFANLNQNTVSSKFDLQPQSILVFTATYNESQNIALLIQGILANVPNVNILVVDDNSPDGTGKILDGLTSLHPNLSVIHRPGKLGLGSAHYMAMLYAIKNQYDILVTMDADLSHDPADIPRLMSKLAGAHFIIGSRYAKGGSCDYSGYRKYLSVIGNLIARTLTGIPLHEFTTSFRVFDVSALSKIKFNWIGNFGYSFFLETVFRLSRAGLMVKEEPIHFYNRHTGVSKIPKLEILRAIRKIVLLGASRIYLNKKDLESQLVNDNCSSCGGHFLYVPLEDMKVSFLESAERHVRCLQCGNEQNCKLIKH